MDGIKVGVIKGVASVSDSTRRGVVFCKKWRQPQAFHLRVGRLEFPDTRRDKLKISLQPQNF